MEVGDGRAGLILDTPGIVALAEKVPSAALDNRMELQTRLFSFNQWKMENR